jgi:hypothetical protein
MVLGKGGIMGGHGHRNMFYATGLPGWMRFGYSPGWIGRSSSGLGPAAHFLLYGQWPTQKMQQYWQGGGTFGTAGAVMPREQELQMLKNQAALMKESLDSIVARIKELEEKEE